MEFEFKIVEKNSIRKKKKMDEYFWVGVCCLNCDLVFEDGVGVDGVIVIVDVLIDIYMIVDWLLRFVWGLLKV